MAIQEFTTEELQTEEWRDIPGYEGRYQASSLGRIRSSRNWKRSIAGHVLAPGANPDGYLFVTLWRGAIEKGKGWRVHRLVALTFIGPCPKGLQVNHIDCDPANNRPGNLEYVTCRENIHHAKRLGRLKRRIGPNPARQGDKSPSAKLTSDDVLTIRQSLLNGVKGTVLAERYGVTSAAITSIKLGKSWTYLIEGRNEVSTLGPWKTRRRKVKF